MAYNEGSGIHRSIFFLAQFSNDSKTVQGEFRGDSLKRIRLQSRATIEVRTAASSVDLVAGSPNSFCAADKALNFDFAWAPGSILRVIDEAGDNQLMRRIEPLHGRPNVLLTVSGFAKPLLLSLVSARSTAVGSAFFANGGTNVIETDWPIEIATAAGAMKQAFVLPFGRRLISLRLRKDDAAHPKDPQNFFRASRLFCSHPCGILS
ncbi:hypothetical protein [Azospirillum sp. Sh1]|uniref:hypothetical protein n=1 Tax=Azospirillum sp. Sh1 TaxID=2607285 RepID=UPI0011ED209D|nr:hypothetical protein [Azospirillum sp. Sh1]KAA0578213.1 hypothetical protein FZ029_10130 [Azospirillum sp. Sh1]